MKRLLLIGSLAIGLLASASANAWWNTDWTQRQKVTLNTSATGADLKENLSSVTVAVRLHTGNFLFPDAKPDGSDLRFVAGDDKTPLKHHVERFDTANELAIVWVQVPALTAGTAAEGIWLYFGNPKAEKAEDAKGSYDASYSAVFHFDGKAGVQDATANAVPLGKAPAASEPAGLIGASAVLRGEAMTLAEHPALKRAAGGMLGVSLWARQSDAARAVLYRHGPLELTVDGGLLTLKAGSTLSGGTLAPGAWQHVAFSVGGGKATLYVDGLEVAAGAGSLPELPGSVALGEGFNGEIDELQIAGALRSADWVKAAARGQGAEAKLVSVSPEGEATESGGHSYFGVLIDNLTVDAWVVIIILMIMFVVAIGVMVGKTRLVGRIDKDNQRFMDDFRQMTADLTPLAKSGEGRFAHSSLFRIYTVGIQELLHRIEHYRSKGMSETLSVQAVNSIKAAMDAVMVREGHRLSSQMVLLTIAISGGPFLGLLGTVVGVMITFAAIAAAGDVNINAIAPGIAAALLATVAGLGVAIPALFGYNYLGSRIKNISADMHIFGDEFITKLAENYTE